MQYCVYLLSSTFLRPLSFSWLRYYFRSPFTFRRKEKKRKEKKRKEKKRKEKKRKEKKRKEKKKKKKEKKRKEKKRKESLTCPDESKFWNLPRDGGIL